MTSAMSLEVGAIAKVVAVKQEEEAAGRTHIAFEQELESRRLPEEIARVKAQRAALATVDDLAENDATAARLQLELEAARARAALLARAVDEVRARRQAAERDLEQLRQRARSLERQLPSAARDALLTAEKVREAGQTLDFWRRRLDASHERVDGLARELEQITGQTRTIQVRHTTV